MIKWEPVAITTAAAVGFQFIGHYFVVAGSPRIALVFIVMNTGLGSEDDEKHTA